MTPEVRKRLRRFVSVLALTAATSTAAWYLLGPLASLICAVTGFLAASIAGDDKLGTCFPLALMFVIVLALLVIALVGVILVHT